MSSAEAGPPTGPAFDAPALPDSAEIWLVRHGATEWSESGRHTSRTDLPLTGAGERQAEALRTLLADLKPSLVLCSPRKRAQDTAGLAGLHVDAVDEDIVEWDYGSYEGRTGDEIRGEVPDWTIWTHGAPGGETAAQVGARADRVLGRALGRIADGPVVLVGHGHFSRALGARWIGLPVPAGARLLLGTAATCVLGAQYDVALITRWNIPNPAA